MYHAWSYHAKPIKFFITVWTCFTQQGKGEANVYDVVYNKKKLALCARLRAFIKVKNESGIDQGIWAQLFIRPTGFGADRITERVMVWAGDAVADEHTNGLTHR